MTVNDCAVGSARTWNGWVWRPLSKWKIADVLAIHARHGIPVNPLYQAGFDRVGCFPCIFSNKEEIRTLADYAPQRIDEVAALEAEIQVVRDERNTERPGRYTTTALASFFQTRDRVAPMGIRDVVEWSKTDRGGKQLPLLQPAPRGGCMRWGLCETPIEACEVKSNILSTELGIEVAS